MKWTMTSSEEETIVTIPLEEIGESYARLRLIHPQADARMIDSLRKFGQIFPVVVTKGERYELIDGFKRVRALKELGHTRVTARVLELSAHGQKAAMMDLNWKRGAISELEEGMVIRSLCREDGLSQVEIAVLVGRHKSWVCRRLSLVERLSDEVLEHMRLGLIHAGIGRELARLPRGNQQAALKTILKYRFCSRECARLVRLLLARPRWNWQSLLGLPLEILSEREPDCPWRRRLTPMARLLNDKLLSVQERFSSLTDQCNDDTLCELTKEEWASICSMIKTVEEAVHAFKDLVEGIRMRAE
jgi:ParB/RepB/Spo0J family partition protein